MRLLAILCVMMLGIVVISVVCAVSADNGTPQAAATWLPSSETSAQEQMYAEINQCRKSLGKPPLTRSLALEQAANDRVHTYSHFSNGMDAGQQAHHNGWHGSGWGENIAQGYEPTAAVDAWFNEKPPLDGHRRNILGDYNVVGAAYNGTNSVAIFGKE